MCSSDLHGKEIFSDIPNFTKAQAVAMLPSAPPADDNVLLAITGAVVHRIGLDGLDRIAELQTAGEAHQRGIAMMREALAKQALCHAQAGADVVGVNVSAPQDTRDKIEAMGRRFLDLRANLSDISCIEGLIAKAREFRGHVDILVNNAGIIRREDAIKFSEKDWDDVIDRTALGFDQVKPPGLAEVVAFIERKGLLVAAD